MEQGVGHNGNGGGSGGARGNSAYRSDGLAGATWSVANNGGGQQAGGAGYVEIRVQDELQFDANVGGGGGQGATIILEIANINTAITAGLQRCWVVVGGEGSTGGDAGNVVVEYRGILLVVILKAQSQHPQEIIMSVIKVVYHKVSLHLQVIFGNHLVQMVILKLMI